MFFNDPEELEEFLSPLAGDVLIRPVIGKTFNAEISIERLRSVGLFTVSANSFRAIKEPQQDFFGLTIPLSAPFTVSTSGKKQIFESSLAHMLVPGHEFNLSAKRNGHFLVSNFFVDPIKEYSNKLLQSDFQALSSINPDISLFTQPGSALLRATVKAWSTLNNKIPISTITLKELEDDLLASFVLYLNNDSSVKHYKHDISYTLNRAEEYINENLQNPITRDQLAEVSNCSLRMLSRAFEKKYECGPMGFIRQRRLDSAYLELLRSEKGSTTVLQIAFNYGFSHVGKFAIEYKKVFGESPSTTLAK